VITRCPCCSARDKGPNKFLCVECWGQLPLPARRALKRTDTRAMPRLRELYDQIYERVPLTEIVITP